MIVEHVTPAEDFQTTQPAENQAAAASGQLSLNITGLHLYLFCCNDAPN